MILIKLNVVPIAQPRPKARAFGGHAQVYAAVKSHPVHAYKAALMDAASKEMKDNSLISDIPISVYIQFLLPRPKSMIKKTKPNPRVFHVGRFDLDNLIKSTTDALNGLVWRDDGCIAELHATKHYAAADELPGVEIVVNKLSVK